MIELDPELQKQAREHARIKRRLWLVENLFSGIYALAWILPGWGVALRHWLTSFIANDWLLVPAFLAIFGGISFVLTLPLGYFSGFVLPHRYGLSNQTLKEWIIDQLKSLAISLPLGLLLVELLYLALRLTGALWWLWAAGGLLFFSVLLANLAPVLLMPIFNKFIPLGEEHAELAARLLRLAEKAGTRVRGVFKMDVSRRTKAANAFLTGIGNTRRIVLGDTLINEFSADEIETVLAHELGHQVHHDIPLLIAFGTLTNSLGMYLASLALDFAVTKFGYTSVADVAAFPALMLILGLYGLLVMPLENGFSRWRENLADDYAISATGKPAIYETAFIRLANQNLGEIDPEKWVVWLFYDHPSLGERIAKTRKAALN
jgi:STE24 endopeptidase